VVSGMEDFRCWRDGELEVREVRPSRCEDLRCDLSRSFFSDFSFRGESLSLSLLRDVRRLSGLRSLVLRSMANGMHVRGERWDVSA
jgi:hypothetical protein